MNVVELGILITSHACLVVPTDGESLYCLWGDGMAATILSWTKLMAYRCLPVLQNGRIIYDPSINGFLPTLAKALQLRIPHA